MPYGLEGVPLVYDERIVGIVSSDTTDRSTGERELLAVPMAEILDGPLGATIRTRHIGLDFAAQKDATDPPANPSQGAPVTAGMPPLPVTEDDEPTIDGVVVPDLALDPGLLHRLSQRARRALYTANVIRERLADPVLSTVHLVAGLYETFGSGLEPLLNRAGIGADRLREILRSTGHREIFFDETYLNADLDALPPCSRNVRFALATATQAAAEEDARDVECRHLLLGLLSARGSAVVRALLDHGVQPPVATEAAARRLAIPGYRPDALTGEDLLGIGNDVEALASLLAARDVALPLSIGLFGEWGSGKSFFMQQMRTRIDALVTDAATDAGQGQSTPYCANVVQLEFNAWHYVDTSLWASLADEIFEGLAENIARAAERARAGGVPPEVENSPEYRQARLATAAAKERQQLTDAEADLHEKEARLRVVLAETETLRLQADAIATSINTRTILQGTANVLMRQPEAKEQLEAVQGKVDEAARTLNVEVPKDALSAEAVRRQLLSVRSFPRRSPRPSRAPAGESNG